MQDANGIIEQTCPPAVRDGLWFDAVLYPYRSLPPQGFLILMSVLGGMAFVIGLIFFLSGAWPIMGFMGGEVLLVYVAFKISYRSGQCEERIRLTVDALTIECVDHKGDVHRWQFQPYWVKVGMSRLPEDRAIHGQAYIHIKSHGRDLFLGRFLMEAERQEVAAALGHALSQHRADMRRTPEE